MTVNDSTFHPNARLMAQAKKQGHNIILIDPYSAACCVGSHGPHMFFTPGGAGEHGFAHQEGLPDLILPRQGSAMGEYGFVLLGHFAMMGVPLVNSIEGITIAKHQFITLQTLCQKGLPVPRAFFVTREDNFFSAVADLGGFPVVAKQVDGMGGDGVAKLLDKNEAADYLSRYFSPVKGVVVEPFIPHEKNFRLLVADDTVAAAVCLTPAPGQFKANIHQQAIAAAFKPDKHIADLAVRAARACCLDIAGVDVMVTKDFGPVIIEVNYSPGFRGLEAATGKNIAKMILECALGRARSLQSKRNTHEVTRF